MIWRACERFGLLPPNVKPDWDSNTSWSQSMLIAYEQVRRMEDNKDENERFSNLVKIMSRAFG